MKKYLTGFIFGCVFKNKVIHLGIKCLTSGIKLYYSMKPNKSILPKEIPQKINKIELVIKIKDKKLFQELFIDHRTNKNYFQEKDVFKIQLSENILEYFNNTENLNISVEQICDLNIYRYNILKEIGEVFVYISYTELLKPFINVYTSNQIINYTDFVINDNFQNLKNAICATVNYPSKNEEFKNEYISKYFKKFLNNNCDLTPELLLLNYDNLDVNLDTIELILVYVDSNKSYKNNDKII